MVNGEKERVLRRRARFLALALAGCHGGEPAHDTTTVTLPESEGGAPIPVAHPDPLPSPDAGTPRVATGEDESIPDGTSPETRKRYENLFKRAAEIRKSLADVEQKLASAPSLGTSPSAKAYWLDLVGHADGVGGSINWMGIHCPAQRPETDLFLARAGKVAGELHGRIDAMRERAQKKLGNGDQRLGLAKWEQLEDEFNRANPRPCLSIACDRW
jgi:hypothetical protein